jgi:hypothetical protein
MELKEMRWESMGPIDLAQNEDKGQTSVNTVLNLGFHKMQGIS